MENIIGAELVVDSKCVLGEGPWWDHEKQLLYWTDALTDKVYIYNPAANENREFYVGSHIGCMAGYGENGILLGLEDGFYSFDPTTEECRRIAYVERDVPNNRINDGKCDSKGRFYFGTYSKTSSQPDTELEITGALYCMDKSLKLTKFFDGVGISNGIAWNADDTVMYYIDSVKLCVEAFDYDAETGNITGRRTVVEFGKNEGLPDGMTIDGEGMLWVAQCGGGQVSRWDPATGKKLGRIELPVTNVTSCCFGGKNLDELYITTANFSLKEEQRKSQPTAGGLYRALPGVRGTKLYKFGY